MEFLSVLNEKQLKSVVNTDGPMMVIAGAGSGKTRVLTYKIAYLIKKGVDPFNILALTFTNKAAREMKERIASIVEGSEFRSITIGTFHAVFAKILHYNAEKIGYPSNFTIYDTQDSKSLIKAITKELGLDDKTYKSSLVQGRISSAKNNLISPMAYETNMEIISEDRNARKPELYKIYAEYQKRCFKAGAMDFDDLLFNMHVLFKKYPDVLHHYQHQFKYILVDEYQDTNYSQYLIIKKLAAAHENICVVGDDAQSIYSFRGANIENILNFRKDYPDFKLFKLEQNYRSTSNIVNAANSVIENNRDRIEKQIWTLNKEGDKIKIIRCLTDNEEGRIITNKIYEIKQREGLDFKDFAILYRTNAQSRAFEESLRKLNLPYKIYGGLSFYQRKEIKDLTAYFRLAANPNDEEALKRVVNYPKRGIGKTTIDSLVLASRQYDVSIWEIISDLTKYSVALNSRVVNQLTQFAVKIKSFIAQIDTAPAYELANAIAQSSGILKELYDDQTPEGISRYENIQELLAGIKEFTVQHEEAKKLGTLSDFLVEVALLTDADEADKENTNTISLMTIHASKGLEFPYVFIVGLEENLFPSQFSLNSRSELEEERRLFYVALTRAKISSILSYAATRYRWGELISSEYSRFIDEIDDKYLIYESGTRGATVGVSLSNRIEKYSVSHNVIQQKSSSQKLIPLKNISLDTSVSNQKQISLKVGYNVEHSRFGKGKVMELLGKGNDQKAEVFFPRVGKKTLILKYAKLKILEQI